MRGSAIVVASYIIFAIHYSCKDGARWYSASGIRSKLAAPSWRREHGGTWLALRGRDAIGMSRDALTTASSPDAGRYYIAARAIQPGETVLSARPDVWAPLWPCELSELSAREINVMRADAGPSPPVGAPSNEAEEETRELIGSCSQYWLLAVRAALLSQDDPATFSSVLTLEDHGETRPPLLQQKLAALCCRMQRALEAGAGVRLEAAVLQRVLGCILVNAFVRVPRLQPVQLP